MRRHSRLGHGESYQDLSRVLQQELLTGKSSVAARKKTVRECVPQCSSKSVHSDIFCSLTRELISFGMVNDCRSFGSIPPSPLSHAVVGYSSCRIRSSLTRDRHPKTGGGGSLGGTVANCSSPRSPKLPLAAVSFEGTTICMTPNQMSTPTLPPFFRFRHVMSMCVLFTHSRNHRSVTFLINTWRG